MSCASGGRLTVLVSPFSRTQHTARLALSQLPHLTIDCRTVDALRERCFGGRMELGSHEQYHGVWAESGVRMELAAKACYKLLAA